MNGPIEAVDDDPIRSALDEIRSTKETAELIANEGPAEDADVPRVLAGLIAHLAEQVEWVLSIGQPTSEEDVIPERAPAPGPRIPERTGKDERAERAAR